MLAVPDIQEALKSKVRNKPIYAHAQAVLSFLVQLFSSSIVEHISPPDHVSNRNIYSRHVYKHTQTTAELKRARLFKL